MTPIARQMLVAGFVGLMLFANVARLSRRGRLSFKYTIGWLVVAVIGILFGLLVSVISPVADALGVTPSAFLGLSAIGFILVITVQLSISISGLQQQVRTLSEELGRLNLKIEQKAPQQKNP